MTNPNPKSHGRQRRRRLSQTRGTHDVIRLLQLRRGGDENGGGKWEGGAVGGSAGGEDPIGGTRESLDLDLSQRGCGPPPASAGDSSPGPRTAGSGGGARRSIMAVRTLHDSLHSARSSSRSRLDSSSHLRRSSASSSRSVSFRTVEVREYPRILGDNPAVTSGPPITLDWGYDPSTRSVMGVDEFEETKPPPREKFQIVAPRSTREEWLMGIGYSRGEIAESVRGVNRTKARRNRTVQNANLQRLEGAVESVRRKVRRWLLHEPRDRALYEEWAGERRRVLSEMDAAERLVEEARADPTEELAEEEEPAPARRPTDPPVDLPSGEGDNGDHNEVETPAAVAPAHVHEADEQLAGESATERHTLPRPPRHHHQQQRSPLIVAEEKSGNGDGDDLLDTLRVAASECGAEVR